MGKRLKIILALIPFVLLETNAKSQLKIKTDALGFTYELHEYALVKQENPPFPKFQFGLLNFGIPTSLDLTNPLRPFVFFKDQGCIVFFDNDLNLAGSPFYMNTDNNIQITACCGSKGSAFWIYDHLNRQLQCIDRSGTVLIQSPRLDIETELVQLLELGQSVVGIDSNGNVITFNLYGNLTERISLNATDLLTNNESIYAVCKDGKILRKDSNWNTICQIKTLDVDINLLDIQDSKLIEHNLPLNIKKVIYYLNN
jgi:hypothetical protein